MKIELKFEEVKILLEGKKSGHANISIDTGDDSTEFILSSTEKKDLINALKVL